MNPDRDCHCSEFELDTLERAMGISYNIVPSKSERAHNRELLQKCMHYNYIYCLYRVGSPSLKMKEITEIYGSFWHEVHSRYKNEGYKFSNENPFYDYTVCDPLLHMIVNLHKPYSYEELLEMSYLYPLLVEPREKKQKEEELRKELKAKTRAQNNISTVTFDWNFKSFKKDLE